MLARSGFLHAENIFGRQRRHRASLRDRAGYSDRLLDRLVHSNKFGAALEFFIHCGFGLLPFCCVGRQIHRKKYPARCRGSEICPLSGFVRYSQSKSFYSVHLNYPQNADSPGDDGAAIPPESKVYRAAQKGRRFRLW